MPEKLALTRQQRTALAVLADEGPMGAGNLWNWQIRPWPTLDNLVAKGLAVSGDWIGPEDGYEFTITDAGRAVLEHHRSQR